MRAYHLISDDLRSDEDLIAGRDDPWRVGETRTYIPVTVDAGGGELITQLGYQSSPTLWDAMLRADGPIACAVDISNPISVCGDCEQGHFQISASRKLLVAIDLSSALRRFACACAERALPIFESAYPGNDRLRLALNIARAYARKCATAEALQSALILARDAADHASGVARIAAMATFGATLSETEDAALSAMRAARWAIDGKAPTGPERAWQRATFDRTFTDIFEE